MHGGSMMSGHVAAVSGMSGRADVRVNSHMNHGAAVSTAAHTAHSSGMKVGPQVRAVAHTDTDAKTHVHPANHGAAVSAAAHAAQTSGMKVGPQVRAIAHKNGKANAKGTSKSRSKGADDIGETSDMENETKTNRDVGLGD